MTDRRDGPRLSHPTRPRASNSTGDIGFAQDKIMAWHEQQGCARPRYLFKLKPPPTSAAPSLKSPGPSGAASPASAWNSTPRPCATQGWERERRIIVTRLLKPVNPTKQDMFWGADQEEFCARTDLLQEATPAQIADLPNEATPRTSRRAENQWGFSGFCSGNGVVTETAARLLPPTYNLWSLFVRVLKDEGHHHEAVTSRTNC
ncbi:MAG: hypothetical protein IPP19_15930 [Verrucomicrobia bacterium]|nr:hypothetical protein [Verrucomicrobiota bacterium]